MEDQNQGAEREAEHLPAAAPDGTDQSAEVSDSEKRLIGAIFGEKQATSEPAEAAAVTTNQEGTGDPEILARIQEEGKFRPLNEDDLTAISEKPHRVSREQLRTPGTIFVPLVLETRIKTSSGIEKAVLTGVPLEIKKVEGGGDKPLVLTVINKVTSAELEIPAKQLCGGNSGLLQVGSKIPNANQIEIKGEPAETAVAKALKEAQLGGPLISRAIKERIPLNLKIGPVTLKGGILRQRPNDKVEFVYQKKEDGEIKEIIYLITNNKKLTEQINEQLAQIEAEERKKSEGQAPKRILPRPAGSPTREDMKRTFQALPGSRPTTRLSREAWVDLRQAKAEAGRAVAAEWKPLINALVDILTRRGEEMRQRREDGSFPLRVQRSLHQVALELNKLDNPQIIQAWRNRPETLTLSDTNVWRKEILTIGRTDSRDIRMFRVAGLPFECIIDPLPEQRGIKEISDEEKLILSAVILYRGKIQFLYTPEPEWQKYQEEHLTPEQRRRREFEARRDTTRKAILESIQDLIESGVFGKDENGQRIYILKDFHDLADEQSGLIEVAPQRAESLGLTVEELAEAATQTADQFEGIADDLREHGWGAIEIEWEQGRPKGEIIFHDYGKVPGLERRIGVERRAAPAPRREVRPAVIDREIAEISKQIREERRAIIQEINKRALRFEGLSATLGEELAKLTPDSTGKQIADAFKNLINEEKSTTK